MATTRKSGPVVERVNRSFVRGGTAKEDRARLQRDMQKALESSRALEEASPGPRTRAEWEDLYGAYEGEDPLEMGTAEDELPDADDTADLSKGELHALSTELRREARQAMLARGRRGVEQAALRRAREALEAISRAERAALGKRRELVPEEFLGEGQADFAGLGIDCAKAYSHYGVAAYKLGQVRTYLSTLPNAEILADQEWAGSRGTSSEPLMYLPQRFSDSLAFFTQRCVVRDPQFGEPLRAPAVLLEERDPLGRRL